MTYTWIATAAFGLEGLVAQELRALGFTAQAEQGGARFEASPADALQANLHLRCADRVLLLVGAFEATTFDQLFEGVRGMPWEQFIPRDGCFPVRGKAVRSQLMSVSDCQAIVKKAIATRLGRHYGLNQLPETGAAFGVDVALHSNRATLTLDASGVALNRRGYRTWNGEAPLRETLAAAVVALSPWRPGRPLYDPMCGTGTLIIEAAMAAANMAPGLGRAFALEQWPLLPKGAAAGLRAQAKAAVALDRIGEIGGSDIDPEALALAQKHLRQAGLEGRVALRQLDVSQVRAQGERGVFLLNPPYGERLGAKADLAPLYRKLRDTVEGHPGWSLGLITSDTRFERLYGRRADRRRRLYNGRIECECMAFIAK